MKTSRSSIVQLPWYRQVLVSPYAVAIGCLLGGIALGVGITVFITSDDSSTIRSERRESTTGFHFTNPLLECSELPEGMSLGERVALQQTVDTMIDDAHQNGTIDDAAIYYRDLNNGPWFGIHEERTFSPASLLKVPLAMSYYRRAMTEPHILTQQFQYEKGADNYEADQPFLPAHGLENEKVYSIEDFIVLMLAESSNEAALALSQMSTPGQIASTYTDFGITPPENGADFQTNVHSYGSFFRILYNATYLSRENSEHILNVMSRSTFRDGIVAGVPSTVTVSHKFGTREISGVANSRQLHDCGIVYAQNPYILCIMTQGTNFTSLATFIKDVSATVYQRTQE